VLDAVALLPLQVQLLPEPQAQGAVALRALLLHRLPVHPRHHLAMPAAESREACPISRGLLS